VIARDWATKGNAESLEGDLLHEKKERWSREVVQYRVKELRISFEWEKVELDLCLSPWSFHQALTKHAIGLP
jgi:hypothetical protein